MTDFTIFMAPELFRAIEQEHEEERRRGHWLAEFRAQLRRERRPQTKRTVVVNSPAHLAGVHKL